ncbi:MAG: DUF4352 domain-containing protein [Desulfosoma sp.]
MALKKCKECGNAVSTEATACPNCGAVLKKKTGCLGYIGAAFLIFIVLGVIGSLMKEGSNTNRRESQSQPASGAKTKAVHKERETVHVGYMSYAVWQSWWSNRLSDNQFLNERPNAAYLFVELTIRNDDKKARMVPPLKLIDQNGAEYEASSRSWAVDGAIGMLESLNPSVSKQGFVVFDVPKDRTYRLKLSGGYLSAEDAYVQLSPKASR